ncbi:Uncharacterised protein [uncultured archaeon]|nr:Uncharacterised protein [uncultured archaeon]
MAEQPSFIFKTSDGSVHKYDVEKLKDKFKMIEHMIAISPPSIDSPPEIQLQSNEEQFQTIDKFINQGLKEAILYLRTKHNSSIRYVETILKEAFMHDSKILIVAISKRCVAQIRGSWCKNIQFEKFNDCIEAARLWIENYKKEYPDDLETIAKYESNLTNTQRLEQLRYELQWIWGEGEVPRKQAGKTPLIKLTNLEGYNNISDGLDEIDEPPTTTTTTTTQA